MEWIMLEFVCQIIYAAGGAKSRCCVALLQNSQWFMKSLVQSVQFCSCLVVSFFFCSLFQTANGNVEAKVVCFYRRRDISSTLIVLADKHASKPLCVQVTLLLHEVVKLGATLIFQVISIINLFFSVVILRNLHYLCGWLLSVFIRDPLSFIFFFFLKSFNTSFVYGLILMGTRQKFLVTAE